MIVKMASNECVGKFTSKRKIQTVVEVETIEDLRSNFNNIKTADVVVYKGDIDTFIDSFTPDNVLNVDIMYSVNPDIVNLSLLDKLKGYNVLCKVPDGYHNMEQLHSISSMYGNIRFCGGHLLALDGINIGLFDVEKEKRYVFKDEYSCQEDIKTLADLDELGITYAFTSPKENVPKIPKIKAPKVLKDTTKKPKVSKPKKQPKFNVGGMGAF